MSAAIRKLATDAKRASAKLALLSTDEKNRALRAMALALRSQSARVLRENTKDVRTAKRNGLPSGLIARLVLDKSKISAISSAILSIAKLPDPVGRVLSQKKRPNGLLIKKISVSLGVILIIYESRPNVTADCMALCLKSGNGVILKGGSEAFYSNRAIYAVLNEAAVKAGVPRGALQFVSAPGRAAVHELLKMNDVIDLVIPRGGEGLIRQVASISKIPVIKHYKGVCHVFVDKDADLKKAKKIVLNAKVQNPSVCNALECLLLHQGIAKRFLAELTSALEKEGVEIRIGKKEWGKEYLDKTLALRIVKDLKQAVEHIETYGSHHSDAIVTENAKTAKAFTHSVDSAAVFVNSSTRFNDGGEFGLGAEMGISTDKLHARGPMGLEELTSYKYVVWGNGQIRQ